MYLLTAAFFTLIAFYIIKSYILVLNNYWRAVEIAQCCTMKKKSVTEFKKYKQAPGPVPLPILGNLIDIGRFKENPFAGFTALSEKYGDIFTLTLGETRCIVVNNLELIREVLNQNGKFFGGRPDFIRYHKLFGGDRNNSLALCDWSKLQQKRRNLARRHCSPRDYSPYYTKMANVSSFEINEFMNKLKDSMIPGKPFHVKVLIQQTCANMFCDYMCSVRFNYDDSEFQEIVNYFDEIFWEINQGYALDFLPWLSPFYKQHTKKIVNWSATIRKFILKRIIDNREKQMGDDEPERDFTGALLNSLKEDTNVSRDTIIFMLEDFIGGHSAVGNLVMLTLAYIAKHPNVGISIQSEADGISNYGQRQINLLDMPHMPYTMATLFEVLRYSSSPIVPHVATEDAVVAGYGVTAGSIVFINNYKLNTCNKYWADPAAFQPERFLEPLTINKCHTPRRHKHAEDSDSGIEFEKESPILNDKEKNANHTKLQIKKNIPHFLPFSVGKRTCIGQHLVRGFGFILIANILQQYNISTNDMKSIKMKPACVALPPKTFPLIFTKRI